MHCLSPSSVLMWALMWVLMWIVMCVLMWILMWWGPHVSPYVNPQNPSASSHTPHTTTSALSGLVASLGLCVCSVCALCVCVLLLSGLPGQEAKLNIKPTTNIPKHATKIIDFRTQHRRFWDPFWVKFDICSSSAPTCTPFFACVFFASPFWKKLCQTGDPIGTRFECFVGVDF